MAIEYRLRVAGVIAFVMSVFAPAEDIDHHVAVKALAEIVSHLRGASARFRVVAIDVEHGSMHHQSHIGAIARGAPFAWIRSETDLIVDDQMNGAAGVVTVDLRKIQGLGDNSLARHGGVAVNQQGNHALAQMIFEAILLGPHNAFDHRIHGLEMTGVGSHRDANGLAAGHLTPVAGAQMILYVAGAFKIFFGDFSFEFRKHLRDALADDVGEHGETAAMRHPDDALIDVAVRGAIQQFVDDGNGGFAAFEGKTLVALEAVLEETLEAVRVEHAHQRAALGFGIELPWVGARLQLLEEPAALVRILAVHELDAHFAGVGQTQAIDQIAQRDDAEGTGVEGAVEIPNGEAVSGGIEIRSRGPGNTQRIDIGSQMPALAPRLNETRHCGLLGGVGVDGRRGGRLHFPANGLGCECRGRRKSCRRTRLRLRAAPASAPGTGPIRRPGSHDDRRCRSPS